MTLFLVHLVSLAGAVGEIINYLPDNPAATGAEGLPLPEVLHASLDPGLTHCVTGRFFMALGVTERRSLARLK